MTLETNDGSQLVARPRPVVHFAPASNWMNDPNGLIFRNGYYHIFYQYRTLHETPSLLCWGHARSVDLLHWEDLPLALTPTPSSPDEDGCFSGCALVHRGSVFLIYTGVQGDRQRPCLAKALDEDLIAFEKLPSNPIIDHPPVADVVGFRDHTLRELDGKFRQLVGSGTPHLGGCVFEYESNDLVDWKYVGVFLSALENKLPGTMWECPDLFKLDSRWYLVYSSHIDEPVDVRYVSGTIESNGFVVEASGRIDVGARWYAPQSFAGPDGRRVVFGWLREHEGELSTPLRGRVGVMSLPREYFECSDGRLGVRPCREIDMLRQSILAPVESSNAEIVLAAPILIQSLEVLIEDPGGSGQLVLELLDADGITQVGVAFSGAGITMSQWGIPALANSERPQGVIRFYYDSGICEAFIVDGQSCSEIFYGCSMVESVRVTSFASEVPLDVIGVQAFALSSVW